LHIDPLMSMQKIIAMSFSSNDLNEKMIKKL